MKNKKKIKKNHKNQFETILINYIYFDKNDINDKINTTTIFSKTNLFTTKTYLKFITSYIIYLTKLYEIILTKNMKLYSFDETTKKSKLFDEWKVYCLNYERIEIEIYTSKQQSCQVFNQNIWERRANLVKFMIE